MIVVYCTGAEKESKYVVLGEKAKAQLIRDSKQHIDLTMTELQKNFLNYTQVPLFVTAMDHMRRNKIYCLKI